MAQRPVQRLPVIKAIAATTNRRHKVLPMMKRSWSWEEEPNESIQSLFPKVKPPEKQQGNRLQATQSASCMAQGGKCGQKVSRRATEGKASQGGGSNQEEVLRALYHAAVMISC
eukprot:CAMPEP_0181092366 /NCGR_PEP_ID=MMETSP1071-20121207/8882_1 /TAXON_ID=35127 /ORGANISM="Thalassiosira sp., Strain NH16" /LENGTH=113 /DNA_ID=CAMNT_0023174545 /DNA_START=193 /DNA_END=535 /DNA_ORIENTATION=+